MLQNCIKHTAEANLKVIALECIFMGNIIPAQGHHASANAMQEARSTPLDCYTNPIVIALPYIPSCLYDIKTDTTGHAKDKGFGCAADASYHCHDRQWLEPLLYDRRNDR